VLLRQLDAYLDTLRTGEAGFADAEHFDHAERMASALRLLIADTARSSAVDRARVRAAVHYFVSRGAAAPSVAARARAGAGRFALLARGRPELRVTRVATDDDRVVNELLRELGRADLIVD
jgi:hypothetical protein